MNEKKLWKKLIKQIIADYQESFVVIAGKKVFDDKGVIEKIGEYMEKYCLTRK